MPPPQTSVNPATGETLGAFETLDAAHLEERLALAARAFAAWRQTAFEERARLMLAAAGLLEGRAADVGRTMTLEVGKPIGASIDEARKCARGCRYYAEHAAAFLADEHVATEAAGSYIRYEPLGPVLAIMPWNFPFWQVFRFAAPALMAGNVALLKHAPNVPQCALAIEQIFRDAGFPDGVFQSLLMDVDLVPQVLQDDRVAAATLTGSERAGSDVASRAAQSIKKSVLELGGSDPFIVLPSADLDAAVATAVKARAINNGQSCIAAKRFIVHEAIADRFISGFVRGMEALKVGDPLEPSTDVGPLARPDLLEKLDQQVRGSIARGARLLTGGVRLSPPGNYYAPTVLADIPRDSPAYREELFGPVASIFRARDLDDALAIANDTRFGLGASVWTRDPVEQQRAIAGLESGQVFINAMVASDPRVPFGGVKRSGFGRELGLQGIREFVNVKTVWIGR